MFIISDRASKSGHNTRSYLNLYETFVFHKLTLLRTKNAHFVHYLIFTTYGSKFRSPTLQFQDLIVQHGRQEVLEFGFLASDLFGEVFGCLLEFVVLACLGCESLGHFA